MIDHAAQATKRKSSKQRILSLLSDGRAHSMSELNAITYRYGGRIHELRKEGHAIETLQVGVDEFSYRLITDGQRTLAI